MFYIDRIYLYDIITKVIKLNYFKQYFSTASIVPNHFIRDVKLYRDDC